jgi:hypothetical protein
VSGSIDDHDSLAAGVEREHENHVAAALAAIETANGG